MGEDWVTEFVFGMFKGAVLFVPVFLVLESQPNLRDSIFQALGF